MRRILAVLGFSSVITLGCAANAGAVTIDPGVKEAAAATSSLQRAQYYEWQRRHRITKCYREFVVGRYVCHTYYRW